MDTPFWESHALPLLPRPPVCSSATTKVPWTEPSSANRFALVLVESVLSKSVSYTHLTLPTIA